jgi:hypothetical protein
MEEEPVSAVCVRARVGMKRSAMAAPVTRQASQEATSRDLRSVERVPAWRYGPDVSSSEVRGPAYPRRVARRGENRIPTCAVEIESAARCDDQVTATAAPPVQPHRIDERDWVPTHIRIGIDPSGQPDRIGLGVDPTRGEITISLSWAMLCQMWIDRKRDNALSAGWDVLSARQARIDDASDTFYT